MTARRASGRRTTWCGGETFTLTLLPDELLVQGGEPRGLLGPLVAGETLNHALQCSQPPSSCRFPAVSEMPTGCPHPPAAISHLPAASPSPNTILGGSCWRHQHLPQRPAFRRPNISKKRPCPQVGAQLTPQPTHRALMFPAGPAPAAAPIPTGFSPSDTPSKNCLSLMTAVSTASLGFQKGEKNPWQ